MNESSKQSLDFLISKAQDDAVDILKGSADGLTVGQAATVAKSAHKAIKALQTALNDQSQFKLHNGSFRGSW